ncbi:MAG: carboxypeptidase-like regulatory domain-containing protein [Acidobacteriia bacterium]|nr:carboxypeptidase-like regulatory domain-containing protein [Terriglobia bacterium]
MKRILVRLLILLLLLLFAGAAFAQKSTGEIKGTVFDPSNAVVPKATVTAKDLATGLTYTTTSGSDGIYLIPNLLSGKYDVSTTAPGFQTSVYSGIIVETGRITDLPVKLTIGAITQTVEVTGQAAMLEVTSNQVAATISNDYIKDLPLSGRDTLQFAALTPGYAGGTFNGLFQSALNISLDGTNVNDTRMKSGSGFSSLVPLRLDAIEEVTVSTTGLEADAAAGGAMTIQFATRRGTSQYHGSVYEQFRNDALNANDFFNNMYGRKADGSPVRPRPQVRMNDFGGSIGGPLKIPFAGFLKNNLFFFANYEDAPRPGASTRTATLLTPEAQSGVFRFIGTDGAQHTVNVLQLASTAGYQSAIDPTVAGVLKVINGTVGSNSVVPSSSNYYQQTMSWKYTTGSRDMYPTARLDYQITNNLAWHGTWNLQHEHVNPTGSSYPGLPGQSGESKFTRYALSNGVDYTITPRLFNSLKFGIQSSVSGSNIGNSVHQWAAQGDKRVSFGSGISSFIPNATPLIRANPAFSLSDDLSWMKGKHTMKFGGKLLRTSFYENDYYQYSGVLNYTLGISSNDPIASVFTAANIPFIRTQDVSTASQLYATLTGRVRQIQGYENIDEKARQYAKFAPLIYRENYASWGLYFQDSYRVHPRLTLNYGLRWEFTGNMTNTNNTFMSPTLNDVLAPSFANFQPGILDANHIPVIGQRSVTYTPDRINPAPNFGFAWSPTGGKGLLGRLLGDNKTVVRSSYSLSYFDEGLNDYYWINTNAGNWRSVSASAGSEYTPGALTLQSPDPAFLVAPKSFTPPFSEYQFAFQNYNVGTTAGKRNGASELPTLRNPYVQSWTLGIQREIAKETVLEVRYVGNRTTHKWHLYGVQEVNIFENGFLTEFINAQNNLAISKAAGVNSFQNRGLPGQVALPIFEAAFGARGSMPSLSASQSWTSNTFINPLTQGNAGSLASILAGPSSPTYYCRIVGSNFGPCTDRGYNAPGPYPINFFVPNPYVGDLTITDDNSYSTYHALQVDLRRRLRNGLTLTANYALAHALSDMSDSNTLTDYYTTIRNLKIDKAPSSFDIRHSLSVYGTYELPVGNGRRFAITNGVVNRIVGGWVISGILRMTSGRLSMLTGGQQPVNVNYGKDAGVVLNGLTVSQLTDMMQRYRNGPAGTTLSSADPSLVGADGRANPNFLAIPTTPGKFGQFIYLYGPMYWNADMSVNKNVRITERVQFTLQVEAMNFLNHPVFGFGSLSINSTSFGQLGSTANSPRNVQIRAYLRW